MRKTTLLGVAVALATLAGGVLAAAPYDFTGHWTGHLQQARRSAATLTADFAMAGARSISGTLSLPGDDGQPVSCPANGKARRRSNLSVRAVCGDGGIITLRGRANPSTQTI